jgi:hypothetical protein
MTEVPAVQFPKNGVLVYDPDVHSCRENDPLEPTIFAKHQTR